MALTICVDFGSTFTKFCVLDLDSGELVMTDKHPTTVASDASIALLAGLEEVKRYVGEKAAAESKIVASSSAAGGLRMVVVGLTRQFSLTAGKNVALGAGARVISRPMWFLRETGKFHLWSEKNFYGTQFPAIRRTMCFLNGESSMPLLQER